MKGLMRLQKSQVNPILKFNALEGWQFFYKELYVAAGYKNFIVMMVAGAGGDSGECSGSNSNTKAYSAGGGGGGSLMVVGSLADLGTSAAMWVGSQGAQGANTGDNVRAGDGTTGGNTTFAVGSTVYEARGGLGGKGGRVDYLTGGSVTNILRSYGGQGGGNSAGLGSGGTGGNVVNDDPPSEGWWDVAGNISGGVGGGGGQGRLKTNGSTTWAPKAGASGAMGTYGTEAAGQAVGTNDGGCGGGADFFPITGVNEEYGGGLNRDGFLAIKLS